MVREVADEAATSRKTPDELLALLPWIQPRHIGQATSGLVLPQLERLLATSMGQGRPCSDDVLATERVASCRMHWHGIGSVPPH